MAVSSMENFGSFLSPSFNIPNFRATLKELSVVQSLKHQISSGGIPHPNSPFSGLLLKQMRKER